MPKSPRVAALVTLIRSLDVAEQQEVLRAIVHLVMPGIEKNASKAPGGRARAAKLTPEQRSEQASKAGKARWDGDKPNE